MKRLWQYIASWLGGGYDPDDEIIDEGWDTGKVLQYMVPEQDSEPPKN